MSVQPCLYSVILRDMVCQNLAAFSPSGGDVILTMYSFQSSLILQLHANDMFQIFCSGSPPGEPPPEILQRFPSRGTITNFLSAVPPQGHHLLQMRASASLQIFYTYSVSTCCVNIQNLAYLYFWSLCL